MLNTMSRLFYKCPQSENLRVEATRILDDVIHICKSLQGEKNCRYIPPIKEQKKKTTKKRGSAKRKITRSKEEETFGVGERGTNERETKI